MEPGMFTRKASWTLLGLFFLFLPACDGPTEPAYCGAVRPPGFETEVGEEVIFRWADCRVTGLVVYKDDVQVWGIGGHFGSPVTYGTVPPGASSLGDPVPLEAAQTYEVLLVSGSWAGWFEFTR